MKQPAASEASVADSQVTDLLGALSDVEKRLAALRQAAADQEAARRRLEQLETSLASRESALAESTKQLSDERASVETRKAALAKAETAMTEKAESVDQDRQALELMMSELQAREKSWAQKLAEADKALSAQATLESSLAETRVRADRAEGVAKRVPELERTLAEMREAGTDALAERDGAAAIISKAAAALTQALESLARADADAQRAASCLNGRAA